MSKVNRKETKELAAHVLKVIKEFRPDLTNKHIRCICSTLYAQLKKDKE